MEVAGPVLLERAGAVGRVGVASRIVGERQEAVSCVEVSRHRVVAGSCPKLILCAGFVGQCQDYSDGQNYGLHVLNLLRWLLWPRHPQPTSSFLIIAFRLATVFTSVSALRSIGRRAAWPTNFIVSSMIPCIASMSAVGRACPARNTAAPTAISNITESGLPGKSTE